jgi:hypothetical protein
MTDGRPLDRSLCATADFSISGRAALERDVSTRRRIPLGIEPAWAQTGLSPRGRYQFPPAMIRQNREWNVRPSGLFARHWR